MLLHMTSWLPTVPFVQFASSVLTEAFSQQHLSRIQQQGPKPLQVCVSAARRVSGADLRSAAVALAAAGFAAAASAAAAAPLQMLVTLHSWWVVTPAPQMQ